MKKELFEYNKIALFQVLHSIFKQNKDIVIIGDSRTGKTTILNHFIKNIDSEDYCILYLCNTELCREYQVFYTVLNKIGYFRKWFTKTIDTLQPTITSFIEYIAYYNSRRLLYQLFNLNEVEKEILNRIALLCGKKKLIILADNYDYWDENSQKMLQQIILLRNSDTIPFLTNTHIVVTTKKSIDAFRTFRIIELRNKECFESYSEYINKYWNIRVSDLKCIYEITCGNLGMTTDVLEYIIDNNIKECNFLSSSYDEIFLQILKKRIENIRDEDSSIIDTLGKASVIGETFTLSYLINLVEKSEFVLRNDMDISNKYSLTYVSDEHYTFSNSFIYNYFTTLLKDKSAEYHYKLALVIERLSPSDFLLRAYHMYKAKKMNLYYSFLTIHCIRQFLSGSCPDKSFIDKMKQNQVYFNVYLSIKEAIDNYQQTGDYQRTFNILQSINPDVDIYVNTEKDYIICLLYYRLGDTKQFEICKSILTEYYFSDNIEFDQWLRLSILLLLLYVNRLGNYDEAKKIERKVINAISSRINYDSSLTYVLRTLDRISPALYNNDVSIIKTERSFNYFEQKKNQYPKEYIMALTNYIGVLIFDMDFDKAYLIASEGVSFLMNVFDMKIYGVHKLINNYIISGIYSKNIQISDALNLYDQSLEHCKHVASKPLIKCNIIILKVINGDPNGCERLHELFLNNNHNDYYVYILGTNLISLYILKSNYIQAKNILTELNNIIPAICEADSSYIQNRYLVFDMILSKNRSIKSIDDLEIIFESTINVNKFPIQGLWRKPLVFSDLQYWSEI